MRPLRFVGRKRKRSSRETRSRWVGREFKESGSRQATGGRGGKTVGRFLWPNSHQHGHWKAESRLAYGVVQSGLVHAVYMYEANLSVLHRLILAWTPGVRERLRSILLPVPLQLDNHSILPSMLITPALDTSTTSLAVGDDTLPPSKQVTVAHVVCWHLTRAHHVHIAVCLVMCDRTDGSFPVLPTSKHGDLPNMPVHNKSSAISSWLLLTHLHAACEIGISLRGKAVQSSVAEGMV